MKRFLMMILLIGNIMFDSLVKSHTVDHPESYCTYSFRQLSFDFFPWPAHHPVSLKDYGVYMMIGKKGDSVIAISAWYFIKTGDIQAKKAIRNAIRFWNRLSGMYMLKPLQAPDKPAMYSIEFNLKYFERNDPEFERIQLDSLRSKDRSLLCQSNCFYVVDEIRNEGQLCTVENPMNALGITCKNYQTRVRRTEIRSENVVAHEIGHTLGLPDRDKEGLMKEDNSGGLWVCRSDIKEILHFVYRNVFDLHGFIDPAIPEGEIIRKEGNDDDCNGCTMDIEFRYER